MTVGRQSGATFLSNPITVRSAKRGRAVADRNRSGPDPLVEAERKLWSYGIETLAGLDDYLAGSEAGQPASRGQAALDSMRTAL